jgi:L-alanine-DL-glutamate epimerase-like enolase superfamily enzyme
MKIDRVELFPVRLPLRRPFHTSTATVHSRDLAVLRLTDDQGVEGLGEITPYPDPRADTLADLIAAFEFGARPALEDGQFAEFDLPGPVLAAIDVALIDMAARRDNVRVADMIGIDVDERVPVNATITSPEPEEVSALAKAAVDAGFTTLKMKVALSEHDELRLAALRGAVGFEPILRLDANGGWRTTEAIEKIESFSEYGLELVEQPVDPDDLSSMHRVRDASMVPIVADEGVRTVEDLDLHIANTSCDGVAIKLSQVGGITKASLLADNAERAGLLTFVTSTIDGPIGLAAGLHLAAARADFSLANGLATGGLFEETYASGLPSVESGSMTLTDRPGLGIIVDEDALADLAIS